MASQHVLAPRHALPYFPGRKGSSLSVQPRRQHGEVGQEDELGTVLGTPRLGSWGQTGQEQAMIVVYVMLGACVHKCMLVCTRVGW